MLSLNEKDKTDVHLEPVRRASSNEEGEVLDTNIENENEVFRTGVDGVEFRTMSWQRAVLVFVKYTVATGILGIPSSLNTLGAVGGGFNIVGWGAMNACMCQVLSCTRIYH